VLAYRGPRERRGRLDIDHLSAVAFLDELVSDCHTLNKGIREILEVLGIGLDDIAEETSIGNGRFMKWLGISGLDHFRKQRLLLCAALGRVIGIFPLLRV
jgi:hypothetical protein